MRFHAEIPSMFQQIGGPPVDTVYSSAVNKAAQAKSNKPTRKTVQDMIKMAKTKLKPITWEYVATLPHNFPTKYIKLFQKARFKVILEKKP